MHFWVEKISLNNMNAKLFQHVISRQMYIIYGAPWLQRVYRQKQQLDWSFRKEMIAKVIIYSAQEVQAC